MLTGLEAVIKTAQHSPVSAFTSLVFNISEKLHSITKLYSQMSAKRSDKL